MLHKGMKMNDPSDKCAQKFQKNVDDHFTQFVQAASGKISFETYLNFML